MLGLVYFVIPMLIFLAPLRWLYNLEIPVYALVELGVFVAGFVIIFVVLRVKKGDSPSISYYKVAVRRDLLGPSDEGDSWSAIIWAQLSRLKEKDGGYLLREGRTYLNHPSTMRSTCLGIMTTWELCMEFDQEVFDWLLRQEHDNGGFPVLAAASPELESTCFVIEALYTIVKTHDLEGYLALGRIPPGVFSKLASIYPGPHHMTYPPKRSVYSTPA